MLEGEKLRLLAKGQAPHPGRNPRQHWGLGGKQKSQRKAGFWNVVERMRIELTTSALRTRRSPS